MNAATAGVGAGAPLRGRASAATARGRVEGSWEAGAAVRGAAGWEGERETGEVFYR